MRQRVYFARVGTYCFSPRKAMCNIKEENSMNTINKNIECTVNSCAYHREHHCTLNAIKVGHSAANVGKCDQTECASFRLGDHGTNCGC